MKAEWQARLTLVQEEGGGREAGTVVAPVAGSLFIGCSRSAGDKDFI